MEPALGKQVGFGINKAEWSGRPEEPSQVRHEDAEFGACLANFRSFFDPVFPHCAFFFLHLGMAGYILCHYMLEGCDLFYYFDFIGYYIKEIVLISEETLNFGHYC